VNQACEHFFPGSGLAIDNDGGIRRGDDPRLSKGILKNLARSHHPVCVFAPLGGTVGRWL
jgi:hypothetical protein